MSESRRSLLTQARRPVPVGTPSWDADGPTGDGIPLVFWVVGPDLETDVTPPLVVAVPPASFDQTWTKKVETIHTRGGRVEQHWGDELVSIAAETSTGAFIGVRTGLADAVEELRPDGTRGPRRHSTIAHDAFLDLVDLYRNNGLLYGESGEVLMAGRVRMAYDEGIYDGHFTELRHEESADTPFNFTLSWNFRVRETVLLTLQAPRFGGLRG